MVHTNVNLCDVLSRGSTDVVCSAGQKKKKIHIWCLCFLLHMHIQMQRCLLFLHLFLSLFLYPGMLLPSQTLKHTWLRRCVCVGVWRGCFSAFISGWHRIPPQYYIICTCTQCVCLCGYPLDGDTILRRQNTRKPSFPSSEYDSTKLYWNNSKGYQYSYKYSILYFCRLCLRILP